MKKLIFLISLIVLISCGKDSTMKNNYLIPSFHQTTDSRINLKIAEHFRNSANSLTKTFDFQNLSYTPSPDNPNLFSVIAREENFNNDDYYAIAFFFDEDSSIFSTYYLHTVNVGSNIGEVSFFDEDMDFKWKTTVDLNDYRYTVQNSEFKANDCGQKVAACIQKAYAEDGWGSVALWVVSAMVPEVAVAVAIFCVREADC